MVLITCSFGYLSKVQMKFLKFHLLKHVTYIIRRHGSIPTTRSSANERKLKEVKQDYQSSNKQSDFKSFIHNVRILVIQI